MPTFILQVKWDISWCCSAKWRKRQTKRRTGRSALIDKKAEEPNKIILFFFFTYSPFFPFTLGDLIDQLLWRDVLLRLWQPFWRWEFASIGESSIYLINPSCWKGRRQTWHDQRGSWRALDVAFNQTGVDETWGVLNGSFRESTNRANNLRWVTKTRIAVAILLVFCIFSYPKSGRSSLEDTGRNLYKTGQLSGTIPLEGDYIDRDDSASHRRRRDV